MAPRKKTKGAATAKAPSEIEESDCSIVSEESFLPATDDEEKREDSEDLFDDQSRVT